MSLEAQSEGRGSARFSGMLFRHHRPLYPSTRPLSQKAQPHLPSHPGPPSSRSTGSGPRGSCLGTKVPPALLGFSRSQERQSQPSH